MSHHCTKKFWRYQYIKSIRKEQISINALLFNGETLTDSAAKADILNNLFVSVFTKDDHSPLPGIRGEPFSNIEQLSVEVNGVYNLLVNIDPHKATGPDGILSRLLTIERDSLSAADGSITYLHFSIFIGSGQAFYDWKVAKIAPLYKKDLGALQKELGVACWFFLQISLTVNGSIENLLSNYKTVDFH